MKPGDLPPFAAAYAPPDEPVAAKLLERAMRSPAAETRIDARARRYVEAIRNRAGGVGGIEDFLREYSISTKEGLALMVLAEALLRVPDDRTTDLLIEDKLSAGDFVHHEARSDALLVSASAWALGISARIVGTHESPESILGGMVRRLGKPAVRTATRQAMRLLALHFVLGRDIDEAIARSAHHGEFLYSYDMLGEGARTADDAARYAAAYDQAIAAIGNAARGREARAPAGISVKLSALHPRYEALARTRAIDELAPRLLALAGHGKDCGLSFVVDAEEADRLELSLDVVRHVVGDSSLAGWNGFGLAVQAYQKRAPAVIDWLSKLARTLDQRLIVRLVKGAYWDTEIKRAQERGLPDYPVFTRKAMTDLSYMACVRQLLAARPHLLPQFGTHNALTVASIIEDAGGVEGYEFQRLHGMGEALYDALLAEEPTALCRIYAPVGGHHDLLAYLVRRLLENGANSSFVSAASDPNVPVAAILTRPQRRIGTATRARNPTIALPADLFMPSRRNSAGIEFGDQAALEALLSEVAGAGLGTARAAPMIDGIEVQGRHRNVMSPIDGLTIGEVIEGDEAIVKSAMAAAQAGFPAWDARPVQARAAALEHAADAIERNRGRFIALLQAEAGKTIDDAVSEVREAADYCRYYAAQARDKLARVSLPGPTGESNELCERGRGVFVCISPWNFPLAIFTGQVGAALAAGNAVVAKPAEQTPLVAAEAVRLLHGAGVAATALHLVPGNGQVGAHLVSDTRVAGVAFTGSVTVARSINRTLAAKPGPIVPLIAETGGINPMIVDATALPEQVTDDVVASAFHSAGQRCSALRLLCVQDELADGLIEMIAGAAHELELGDPRIPSTQIGPVIDAEAKQSLDRWIAEMARQDRLRYRWDAGRALPSVGTYVPPCIVELDRAHDLKEEVFGPVLHVVRYRADELDRLVDEIVEAGYGLTLGVESRIEATVQRILARVPNGNVYVNRSMIGAVVGSQPFGGCGLSGTGPKAGGPNYLRRFTREQTVTINTAAAGGNASLLTQDE
jgi:RHH-type transcriptional regulator, proline utilization regulon repressor / proline dehydrogenase / delta 1-pyrroline-5-carboxylate dehydrogenase